MTYTDTENSATEGAPIELYEFRGTFNNYFMTSSLNEVISRGQRFLPVSVMRNALKISTAENTDGTLEIEMPFDHALVREYAYQNAPPDLRLTINRCHRNDPDNTVILWRGRVTGFSVEAGKAKLRVPASFSYLLEGNTPNPRYQGPCNHVLYDARCGVDPSLHQHVATVSSIVGNRISLSSLPFATDEAAAGMIFSNSSNEGRMVVSNQGDEVVVTYGFSGLRVGHSVTIRKGCDHSMQGHCKTRFSNGARFGGFNAVPDRNPFTSSLE